MAFAVAVLLFVSFCAFIFAFVSDIEISSRTLNDEIVGARGKFTIAKRIECKSKLRDIVQFHSDTRELSDFFNSVIQSQHF